ncbi:MAG: hypothetical protein NWF14_05515, partial [Candidatus Bathyarchaeota archaeon]|nr:hypothetical protein [Candidatus Bathyarchaeota archaeon]
LSVPMKDRLILDPRGEEAFDSLLLAQLFMFNAVYYHRTTRAAVKVISDFLKEAISKIDFNQFVRDVNCYSNLDENFLLYHQSLLDSVYRNQLIERKIPYTRFEEQSRLIDIGVSDKDLADILTRNTRSKLSSDLRDTPDKAFFIDTPTFRLNPQFGQQEDFIFLADPRETRGYRPRRVLETTWGSLRKKMFLLRLYIHDDYKEYADKIVDSFWSRPAETHV